MNSKRTLERQLADVADFPEPRVELEQYPTPAGLAAHLVHLADLHGDVAGRTVVDLGAGTGVLALGAALRDAKRAIGLELDAPALAIARENAARLSLQDTVDWVVGDAMRAPLCPDEPVTVIANPPFGAQDGNVHADRRFLETAARIAAVSYTIHNAGSHDFVEAFATDEGGDVTHAFEATLTLPRRFSHHTEPARDIDVEVFRIEWEP